jgi:Holliday junction resolvasome RuvABC endonuclease subunit
MKQYLGIDQSYSGFAIILLRDDGSGFERWLGNFPAKNNACDGERLFYIGDWLKKILTDNGKINSVAMEGYANGAKFGREKAGELGGLVKAFLWKAQHIPLVVPPTSLKKFATGSGAAKKDNILMHVYKRWGAEFADNNLADAFVLAQMALAIDNPLTDGLTGFQKDVIKQLGY